jgi:hypothetical protein
MSPVSAITSLFSHTAFLTCRILGKYRFARIRKQLPVCRTRFSCALVLLKTQNTFVPRILGNRPLIDGLISFPVQIHGFPVQRDAGCYS